MLDKSMKLFSLDDFRIFTDPPHPQFNDDTPHPRFNDGAPLWLCPIIEPGVRGFKGLGKNVSYFSPKFTFWEVLKKADTIARDV